MKYVLLIPVLFAVFAAAAQPSDDWVQIRKSATNGTEDVWVRKESPREIEARPPLIHDTIYIDSFRNAIWAACAHLRRYSKPTDSVMYDTTFFTHFGIVYSSWSGYVTGGHRSKKRHSTRTSGGEWISGDYYYVIHQGNNPEKSDTLKKFSNEADANAYLYRKAHRYLALQFGEHYRGDRLYLYLDEHQVKSINLFCSNFQIP